MMNKTNDLRELSWHETKILVWTKKHKELGPKQESMSQTKDMTKTLGIKVTQMKDHNIYLGTNQGTQAYDAYVRHEVYGIKSNIPTWI